MMNSFPIYPYVRNPNLTDLLFGIVPMFVGRVLQQSITMKKKHVRLFRYFNYSLPSIDLQDKVRISITDFDEHIKQYKFII